MSYIGNTAQNQAYAPTVAYFSGNASTTAFTLPLPVASVAQIIAVIENVIQNPGSAYTVSGNTITFTSAPPSGTNNIWIEYTSPITQIIAPGQNTVTPSSLSVTNALYWDANSNVGIGTTSPLGRLAVYYNANTAYNTGLSVYNASSGSTATTSFQLTNDAGNRAGAYLTSSTCTYYGGINTFNLGTVESIPFVFLTGNSERMRIDSSGNLLVGTTTNTYVSKLVLNGGASNNTLECVHTGTADTYNVIFSNGNGAVGSIRTNGSATAYYTSSDYRLKENIAPMTGALGLVQQLKPVTYTWKTDGSNGQGFIAHELQEVVPDAVGGEKNAVDAEGNPVYQGIDTSFLVATLTAAIQELKAEFDAYKATHP